MSKHRRLAMAFQVWADERIGASERCLVCERPEHDVVLFLGPSLANSVVKPEMAFGLGTKDGATRGRLLCCRGCAVKFSKVPEGGKGRFH